MATAAFSADRSARENHDRDVSIAEVVAVDTPLAEWKYLVIHHSATESGSIATIDAAHRARVDAQGRPWRGIGYHFVIGNGRGMPDGAVEATFRWQEQQEGAHAGSKLFNQYGIGVCLIGNFESAGPTPAQLAALKELVHELKDKFRLSDEQILRHGDLKATACPGKLFSMEWLAAAETEFQPWGDETRSDGRGPVVRGGKEGQDHVATIFRLKRAAIQRRE